MIALTSHEQTRLRDINRAGAEGLTLREVGVSAAIRLGLAGCATILKGVPQRVVITSQGRAYLQRSVWA